MANLPWQFRTRDCQFFASACLLVLSAIGAFGQSTDATLLGLVHDPSGAAVPGVRITATDQRTNISKFAVTNETGNYELPALMPSEYTVTAEGASFKKQTIVGIVLQVNQRARVDIGMQLGEVTESITVQERGLMVETESGAIGTIVDNKSIVDLPLNGRNFTQLATLTPGVIPSDSLGTGRASSVFVSGSRNTKTEFLVDGISATGPINGGTGILPSIDALQEFKVQSSAFSAEFGRASAVINTSIKSGSNAFHGTAFDFLRNDAVDARNTFAVSNPPLKRNQFGFTLGGPVKPNQTFFFANYEGQRVREGLTYDTVVPTAAQLRGDFSASSPIFDPATTVVAANGEDYSRQQFTNNVIPANSISAQAQYFLKYFPQANVAGNQYAFSPSSKNDSDQFTLRLDTRTGEKGNLFGRYTVVKQAAFDPVAVPSLGGSPLDAKFQNAGLNYTYALRPNLLLESRLGYNRENTLAGAPGSGKNYTVEAGIQGFDLTTKTEPHFPAIGISGFTGLGGRSFRPLANKNDIYQIVQTAAWMVGKHTVKAGIDFRQQRNVNYNAAYNAGVFNFYGGYTDNPLSSIDSGSAFADFMLGLPADAQRSFPRGNFGNRYNNFHYFVQDDWRVSSKLTVNFGVRYEFNPWPAGYHNQLSVFDRSTGKIILSSPMNLSGQAIAQTVYDLMPDVFETTAKLHLPKQIIANDKNNFAPRIGLAFRPFGGDRTVLRAGYGIFYDLVNGNGRTGGIINPPYLYDESAYNNNPVPNRTWTDFFGSEPPSAAVPPLINSFNLHQRTPYSHTWNLAVQRQLAGSLALEVAYVGKKGTHQERDIYFNQPDPGPGDIQSRRPFSNFGSGILRDDGGNSNYNALQVKAEKRYSAGLTFLVSYTWSKSIDESSSDIDNGAQDNKNLRAERAVSDYDFPHILVASGTYNLPFGQGRRFLNTKSIGSSILGGWELGAIMTARSGPPFTPMISTDNAGTGTYTLRPNRIGSGKLDNRTPNKWFNAADFTMPDAYTYGNSGRNILRAPGLETLDLTLMKDIPVTERVKAQFRAEFFNALNHVNYGGPNNLIDTADAGAIYSAGDPRILQFAIKVIF